MIDTREISVKELHLYHKNPRIGDVDSIAESLRVNGQYRAIVVNRGTHTGRAMEVLAGNHTLKAARNLGWEKITAHILDVDEDIATRIVLADNRTADLGDYDQEQLLELLESIDSPEGTGFEPDDLLELFQEMSSEPEKLTDEDLAPETPKDSVTKFGDVVALGDSLLYVGDATDTSKVLKVFGERRADCVWTDPPYGVDYVGKTKEALTIQNDTSSGLSELLTAAYSLMIKATRPGSPVYIAHADTERIAFQTCAEDAGLIFRENLVWVKNTLVLGHSDYHYKHEPILYCFTPGGNGRLGRGGARWFGDDSQTTVFEVDKPARNAEHPTMKPVALIQVMIKNSCPPGGTILDCFAGSGSTLIAAYGLGMNALLVEYDPRYADVICRRWQEHTGQTPKINGTPTTFTD